MSSRSNMLTRRSAPSIGAMDAARAVFNIFSDAVVVIDGASQVLAMNPAAMQLFAIPEGAMPDSLDALLPASALAVHRAHVVRFAHGSQNTLDLSAARAITGRRFDGSEFAAVVSISRWEAHDGTTQFVAVIREDRRRRGLDTGAEWTRRLLTGVLATSGTAMLVVDESLVAVVASESFRAQFLDGDDPTGTALPALMSVYRAVPNFDILHVAVQAVATCSPVRCVSGTGWGPSDRWFDVVATPLHPGSGALLEVTDVTAPVQAARSLAVDTNRDATTGLMSREGIVDWFQCEREEQPARQLCVTMLQIDQFDVVDETLGTRAGDELLIQVAQHLSEHLPQGAVAARTDRAIFCVAYPCTDLIEADLHSAELRDAVRRPVTTGGRTLRLTAAVGTAFTSRRSSSARTLREADAAMAEARRRGGNRYASYSPHGMEMGNGVLRKWDALADALQHRQMEVWFQPIISLVTRRPFAAEALCRWNHPQLGEISPAEFIPLAEWGAEIGRLGAFVQDRAAEMALAVRGDIGVGLREFQVSINVSSHELAMRGFAASALRRLLANGAGAAWFAIEIDEDVLEDNDECTMSNLQALAAAGVCITVGNFGAGSSSMERLLEVPITRVKISRRFIASMLTDPLSARVVATTIAMVRELGIEVVAEGVETVEQVAELIRLGCTAAQGYRFAPAVPATELNEVLRDLRHGDGR